MISRGEFCVVEAPHYCVLGLLEQSNAVAGFDLLRNQRLTRLISEGRP
jgi:hypothetical protein